MRVATYNIWFSQKKRRNRTEILCQEILQQSPDIDVVCFQEVTQDSLKYLNELLCNKFPHHYPCEIDNYGSVTFSRYEFIKTQTQSLISNMGRKLILVTVNINNKNMIIGNCHFESEFNDNNIIKLCQYDVTKRIFSSCNIPVIMCADTNIQPHEEDEYLNTHRWNDSWKEAGEPQDENYTYDTVTNSHLNCKKLRCRIDRINYKGDLKQINFKLLKGVKNEMLPSDHYGVMVDFE